MTKTIKELPALMILDVQKGFDDPYWGDRNNPKAEDNIVSLLKEWRNRIGHVIYSQHMSIQPDSPLHYKNKRGVEFKDCIQPLNTEAIFQKNVNSAFIGTGLETYLKEQNIHSVLITGLSTQHCVSTTTRMSGNLGYKTFLVSDAIAAFGITDHNGVYHRPESIQEYELAMLHNEFATIVTTEQVFSGL
ncbi:cysteine hydrolase family protein [Bacillus sp. B1-b2]|uniref:cysteine hydrolase family protein n=1 Tax=Bacillus sp. B1-b2 TaxID=2653201 RepID=UPI0012628B56|nr:cysteine hydrolase family protein [Bacillus sp. B1-b2]KAB7665894.1 cysteine hydrolase [Bacillus sp. B1-b2]